MSEAESKGAMPDPPTSQQPSRDATYWAKPVDGLRVGDISSEATNLNVEGRHLSSPVTGFGQMWQKTYWIRLTGADVTPEQVIKHWKANFPEFWPEGNRFYGDPGIVPGQVAVLNLAGPGGLTAPGGGPLISTGIMVIYADDESFSFMTPQGHMFAGMITFSAETEDGVTFAQVQALIRASDPIYELGCRLGVVHRNEDAFWHGTLTNLAASFHVHGQTVSQQTTLVDPKMQLGQAGNIWHNAAIRTGLYVAATPVRWARKLGKG
jgi:hypothetical protein